MTIPHKNELTLELSHGVYGRLCQLAVQQRCLPVELAEEAVAVYVDALVPEHREQTVEVRLPASTIQYWRHRGEPIGRSVGEEIAILVLMRTIEAMRDDGREGELNRPWFAGGPNS